MLQKVNKSGTEFIDSQLFHIFTKNSCVCMPSIILHFVATSVSKAHTELCHHRFYNLVRKRDKPLPQ